MQIFNKFGLKRCVIKAFMRSYINPAFQKELLGSRSDIFTSDVAIVDHNGTYKYKYIIKQSESLNKKLEALKIKNKNVAVLLPNDVSFVVGMFGIWKSENTVVPLYSGHPNSHLEYFIEDSEAKLIITTAKLKKKLEGISKTLEKKILLIDDVITTLPDQDDETKVKIINQKRAEKKVLKNALIVYTSGTTGKPKGVVLSHANLAAQINSLADAWQIKKTDACLHCLPLHHVHGIINALLCPLGCGGSVIMEPKFDAHAIWHKLAVVSSPEEVNPTIFMAVPTMYSKLIDTYHDKYDNKPFCREFIKVALSEYIRLMVSGSAPLRSDILREWQEITGHTLLERYGMTEIGMALTNPLNGERKPGFVGTPFPGVNVRIAHCDKNGQFKNIICEGNDYSTKMLAEEFEEQLGELFVKSDSIFKEYWKRPEETTAKFMNDKWFSTGDTAVCENGYYKIMGRTSVDIIKSGGFKVSALEVENVLMCHPDVKEVAVTSVHDVTWGEKICAIIVWQGEYSFNSVTFLAWAKERLPHYQVPKVIKIIENELPKSEMGKVNKIELTKSLFPPVDIV